MTDSSAPTPSSPPRTVAAAGRHRLLPALLLTAAMALLFALHFDRAHFYAPIDWNTGKNLAIVENLSPEHNFLMFTRVTFIAPNGESHYDLYNRFPVGGFALLKLVILPFGDDLAAKVFAARMLMLAFLTAAAFLAYRAIARIASSRWIALTAVLAAFSSYYVLRHSTWVSNEMMMDLFGVTLTFHGMVVFVQEGRFRQLLIKTCIALLIGWHVYALLPPFIALGLGAELVNAVRGERKGERVRALLSTLRCSRHLRLGVVALLFGAILPAFNFASEHAALGGAAPLTELPSVRSALGRIGLAPNLVSERYGSIAQFAGRQFHRAAGASYPYALIQWERDRQEMVTSFSVALGIATVVVCLLGLLFVRRRILLTTLALSGFCWALLARGNVVDPGHSHEAIFYVGIPLTLVTLLLLGASKVWGARLLPGAAAVVALPIFALSASQMTRIDPPYDQNANIRMRAFADISAIRQIAKRKNVFVNQDWLRTRALYGSGRAWRFLLAGSAIRHQGEGAPSDAEFTLMPHRDERLPLLTPDNEIVFLYGQADTRVFERSLFDSIVAGVSGEPDARAAFNLHFDAERRALVYSREPCSVQDIEFPFFLHITPENNGDLPEERRTLGFDRRDFHFAAHGILFEGRCAANVPLPDYPMSGIRTGQWIRGQGEVWDATVRSARNRGAGQ